MRLILRQKRKKMMPKEIEIFRNRGATPLLISSETCELTLHPQSNRIQWKGKSQRIRMRSGWAKYYGYNETFSRRIRGNIKRGQTWKSDRKVKWQKTSAGALIVNW